MSPLACSLLPGVVFLPFTPGTAPQNAPATELPLLYWRLLPSLAARPLCLPVWMQLPVPPASLPSVELALRPTRRWGTALVALLVCIVSG